MREQIGLSKADRLKMLTIAIAVIATTSNTALAQYACPAGYTYAAGACQPSSYSNPVSGAASGSAAGAAAGSAAAGPVGGLVGGALGIATGTVAGTANAVGGAVTPTAPACAPGYVVHNGACYPAR